MIIQANLLAQSSGNDTYILTVGLTIFLFSREHITFLGSWFVTISLKKFLIAIVLYFCAFATILFIAKNMFKIKLSAIVMIATIGLGSAHSDFFHLKVVEVFTEIPIVTAIKIIVI